VEMQAYAGGELPEMLGPLRAFVLAHVTPFAVADAAIINDDDGRLLLIRAPTTGCGPCPAAGWTWARLRPRGQHVVVLDATPKVRVDRNQGFPGTAARVRGEP